MENLRFNGVTTAPQTATPTGIDQNNPPHAEPKKKTQLAERIDTISFYLLTALTFLLPVIIWPGFAIPFTKSVVALGFTLVLSVLWIIKQLQSDRLTISAHPLPFALAAFGFVFLISGFFAPHYMAALFGVGMEVGTSISVIMAVVLALLVPTIARTQSRIFTLLATFFIASCVLALYQLVRITFGVNALDFGVFVNDTDNLLGKWNELALFFGLSALLSSIALESLSLNKLFKVVTWGGLIISLFFLLLTNFNLVLIPVAAISLVGAVYQYVVHRSYAWSVIVTFVVAVLCLSFGTALHRTVYTKVSTRFAVSQVEISPSFSHTFGLMKQTLKRDPLLGVGPQHFAAMWLLNKPVDVNQSQFWENAFVYGRGLIPTYFVTAGLLGGLIALACLVLLLYYGLRVLWNPSSNSFNRYLSLSSFSAAAYLWVFQCFYVPTTALMVLATLFTGLFLASLRLQGAMIEKRFIYKESPRASFAWTTILVAFLVCCVGTGVVLWNKVAATRVLTEAYKALNANDIAKGEALLLDALKLDEVDTVYRTLVDLQIGKMGAILTEASNPQAVDKEGKPLTNARVAELLTPLLSNALQYAEGAIKQKGDEYQNWVSLGSVYEAVMPLGYQGAYENAVAAYTKAMEFAPLHPSLPLLMARLEASKPARKDYTIAREWIQKALRLKSNYSEALYLDSQLSVNEGNVKNAIATVTQLAFLRPSDPSVFFQLGYLKYSNKEYQGAIEVLAKAVDLNPQYANARYFLGLSLSNVGDTKAAIEQFEIIAKTNPENAEVVRILANLRAGRGALNDAPAAPAPSGNSASSKKANTTPKKLPLKGE